MSARGARLLRAENGASLRRRRTEASRMDRDVVAYANKGQTERPNRIGMDRLNQFVRGIKRLGLWKNMVCWPGRSTVRSRTDLTAHSLGGLVTADGTLSSASIATQDPAGWDFLSTASARRITATISGKDGLTSFHCIAAIRNQIDVASVLGRIVFLNPHGFNHTTTAAQLRYTNGLANLDSLTSTSLFRTFHAGQDGGLLYLQQGATRNATAGVSVALSGNDLVMGCHPTNSPLEQFRGEIAFCAFFNVTISESSCKEIDQLLAHTVLRGTR